LLSVAPHLRQQHKATASLALPVAHDAAWQPRADVGQPQGTVANPLSASLVGGEKVRRSAGCIAKRAAICAAAVVLLLGLGLPFGGG
jgi:hypothetical protein